MTLIAALLYFSIVNVAAASLHFIDEVSTLYGGRGFRTPDYAHLLLSLLGGWLAAFAVQRALRRKPRTESFAPSSGCPPPPMLPLFWGSRQS